MKDQKRLTREQIEDLVIQFGLLPHNIFPHVPNPIIVEQFENQSKTNNFYNVFND